MTTQSANLVVLLLSPEQRDMLRSCTVKKSKVKVTGSRMNFRLGDCVSLIQHNDELWKSNEQRSRLRSQRIGVLETAAYRVVCRGYTYVYCCLLSSEERLL